MRGLYTTTLALAICLSALGQQPDLLVPVNQLLYDSKYEDVISTVDRTKSLDTDSEILLKLKKTEALILLGRFSQAGEEIISCREKLVQSKSKTLLEGCIVSISGFLELNQGRYDLALQELIKATELLQPYTNSLELAQALSYLGQLYISTGKYKQAEEQLQQTINIRLQKLPEAHELIAASYNDLGLVYSQLDVDKAFEYYEKAFDLYKKIHGDKHPKLAIANTNLGVLHLSEKLYGDAVTYFEAALKIWETIYPQPHPNKALVLMNLGSTYSGMGDTKATLAFYEKAIAMYKSTQGEKHPDVAFANNLLGNVNLNQNAFDEALTFYQTALVSNVSDFNSTDISKNPTIKNFYNGTVLLYSLMYKAEALESRHFGKTLKQSDLELSLSTLQVCDSLINKLRQQATNESDKIAIGSVANEIYADGVRVAFTLSENALSNRKLYRELSFYFAEKSKSAVLLDAISDTNAKSFAGIPNKLLEDEKELKASLALLNQKLAQKPEEKEEKKLREAVFTLNQTYSSFIKNLEKQYPEYFNLKYNSAAPSLKEIQNLISEKTAVLTYFIDEERNKIFTYTITKNSFKITESTRLATFDRYITGLRNSLYYMEPNSFMLVSRSLGKQLIPKLPASIKDLIIIPTGRLSIIPFETLLTGNVKEGQSQQTLPYLIKKYAVRYEFSAGLLLQKKKEAILTQTPSALLCAPVSFNNNLVSLPGTESEVNTIAALFTAKNLTSRVVLNNQANESVIKENSIQDYSVIHLATHGIVDEQNPELSQIYLQPTSTEDGNLYAGEIYNLKLNANLVTLSACETGLGKLSKGEGVIGLSRALVYAGAKNLIVSFWSVSDESTEQFMTDFYTMSLASNMENSSENLRQAKLNMLKGKFSSPFYWAPFILIGY
jgi:CHAT domain-containing protein